MKKLIIYSVAIVLFVSCRNNTSPQPEKYQTIDYVTVGKKLSSVEPPYIIDLKNKNKQLVFIGCDHNHDTAHKQFPVIKQYFTALHPQIAFNEGGQVPDSVHYKSGNDAILGNGTTGYLKYLCDQAGIAMMDGDLNDSTEFSITLKKHPKEELFLYYVMERMVIPYLNGAYGSMSFEEFYSKAINAWFVKPGFPLAGQEKDLSYFKELYQTYMGHPFELKMSADIERFDYINGGDCKFCAIGRTSKMVRDSILLTKIDHSLDKYDKVMVTFGHGHALAIEPALKQLINKKR
jgi:hypothetical protein